MTFTALSDEDARAAVAALREHGTQVRAAAALGITRSTLQNRLRRAAERGFMGYDPVLPGFRVSQTTTMFGADGRMQHQSVQQKPDVGESFAVPDGHVVKGISALVDPEGRIINQWIRTREGGQALQILLDQIKAVLAAAECHATLPDPPITAVRELLTFYPVPDVHMGALAWHAEGGEDYDLRIAERVLKSCMGELISRSAPSETAVILDLGDFLHVNDSRAQTPKSGNHLDVDGRFPKVVKIAFLAVVWMIEMALQKHQKVIYRKLSGNHDEDASSTFALGIWAYFRDNPRVEVDISPRRMWVHQFGETLLVGTHGDMLRMDGLAGWVAAAHPKEWGATKHRYGWTGHVHNKTALTLPGITVESLNSPAAKDGWHAAMGYQSPRNMISVTYHQDRGERDRLTVAVA